MDLCKGSGLLQAYTWGSVRVGTERKSPDFLVETSCLDLKYPHCLSVELPLAFPDGLL